MNATKGAGVGLGAVLAGALASCHLVQAAVLGMLGALGMLPFIARYRGLVVFAVFACGVLVVYGVVRLWHRRRDSRALPDIVLA
jgi:hypothetical protein